MSSAGVDSRSLRFLEACQAVVAEVKRGEEMQPYLRDWRGRGEGNAWAVCCPASTAEVVALVRLCGEHGVAITPQGGNTGLVLGSTPPAGDRPWVVLSLRRMNRLGPLDPINNTIEVEAGVVLQTVQEAAAAAGRLFPLSLAAEGSCTVGGNLATNAGGIQVLRYGSTRSLCLGLEVVLASGQVYSGLYALHKNNSGYDLRDLFIGSEGTLGVITKALLRLYPATPARATAWVFADSMEAVLALWQRAQQLAGRLSSFEVMQMQCVALVARFFPPVPGDWLRPAGFVVLLELADGGDEVGLQQQLAAFLQAAQVAGEVSDALLAQSLAQARALWRLREHIPLAEAAWVREGQERALKHDIALPISRLSEFVAAMAPRLAAICPEARPFYFGHCGDGNLHYNVFVPVGNDVVDAAITAEVFDLVADCGGSFSAEHGVGRLRVAALSHYRSATELVLMRGIKQVFDPANLFNPGVVLEARD